MKFGKQLELNVNPEWRDKYVPYKRLKRIIKRVSFEMEKEERARLGVNVASESSPLIPTETMESIQSVKREFWDLVELCLRTVNDFYRSKIVILSRKIKEFEMALQEMEESRGHIHSRSRLTSSDFDFGFSGIQDVYDELVDLRTFAELNFSGFRKIVKKFDKATHENTLDTFMNRLELESFYVSNDVENLIERLFEQTSRDKLEAGNVERKTKKYGSHNELLRKVKRIPFLCSAVVFALLLVAPIFPEERRREQHCLAMLTGATMLWVLEAIPYFATALMIPPLVVFLGILDDKSSPGKLLNSKQAAKEVMSLLVNHTTILIMGGYAISAAFSKCQIELYIAAFLQRMFKKQPRLFLLAIMQMGLFLSMWISNHTAPVLCVSVLLPIVRDFPPSNVFAKTLLIGLAFACNLGGMMTPIASLQNTLAVFYLEKEGYELTFGQWMLISIPFCTISTVLCWGFLLWFMDPRDAQYIPQIVYDQKKSINRVHVAVILLSLITIAMWATISWTSPVFGDLSIIAMIFMVLMFGSGILSQFDFNSFSWHILFLIGGGNVLGEAVQRSGLLKSLSQSVIHMLPTNNVWLLTVELCLIVLCLTTFVSHTVASIILLPIIVELSVQMGNPHIPVVCCALSISAAMALPFSSFPNINSLLVEDDHSRPYLQVYDFLRVGVLFSFISVGLIITLGYFLIVSVLGYTS